MFMLHSVLKILLYLYESQIMMRTNVSLISDLVISLARLSESSSETIIVSCLILPHLVFLQEVLVMELFTDGLNHPWEFKHG